MDRKISTALLLFALILFPLCAVAYPASSADIDDDIHITKSILDIQIDHLGTNHIQIAHLFHTLGALYEKRQDIEHALPHYESALTIYYSHLGLNHPRVQEIIYHLSSLYSHIGEQQQHPLAFNLSTLTINEDIAIAQHIYQQQKLGLEPEHPKMMRLLETLAHLHYKKQDFQLALILFAQLVHIQEKAYQSEHPAVARTLQMIGDLYQRQGDTQSAVDIFQRALSIWKKTMPTAYRKMAICLNRLSYLHYELKETPMALKYARQSQELELQLLQHVLSFSSEQQRLAHTQTHQPYSVPATIGDAATLARAVLIYKGVVLDSLVEDLRLAESSKNPHHHELLRKRNLTKERLMQMQLNDINAYDATAEKRRQQIIATLERDIRRTEQQLGYSRTGTHGTHRALEISVEDIQQTLDSKTALIEFIHYPHYLGNQTFEDRYGALIFMDDQGPQWVPLSASSDIDTHIRRYQHLTRSKDTRDEDLQYNLQRLYNLLWLSIEKSLPSYIHHVILSPTHRINFVSFATLLTPRGEFLNERYTLSYVTNARDLLRQSPIRSQKSITIIAHPTFGNSPKTQPVFASLPGTLTEGQMIEKLALKNEFIVNLMTQEEASEENLKQVQSPYILHIATHGFFAGQTDPIQNSSGSMIPLLKDERQQTITWYGGKAIDNPMHHSGLALAWADNTIHKWRQGLTEPISNDGLVTAEEVSLLNLRDTWLVVLSACNTGLGEAQTGEGVFGLRRGFIQAGARNLIMTLWNIPDEDVTPEIIREIYGAIFQGQPPAQAVAETQKVWMHQLREQQGLHAAVKKAGSYIAISQDPVIKEVAE